MFVISLFFALDLGLSLNIGIPPFSASFQILTKSIANSIGSFDLRSGHLADDRELREKLQKTLKPLDIILVSAPFKGTSFFTPGRNTHMAIWLGSEQDWKIEGWAKRQHLKPLSSAIASGHALLQSDRHGTTLSHLEEILNADEITIFRSRHETDAEIHFDRALQNMGKAYDYNLDGLDHQKLICTELATLIFPDLAIKPPDRAGRSFILPDEMLRALEQSTDWQSWFHQRASAGR